MALQDILKKIQKETDEKMNKIDAEHKEKLKKIGAEYENKKKAAAEEMDKKVTANVKKIYEKTEILAKMEAKNELLKQKRALIDATFEETIKKLTEDSGYEGIMTELLKKSPLEGENVEVIPAKGKVDETKKALAKSGKNYKMSEHATHIRGGFILRTKKIEIDNSFESIIKKELKDELELEIAKILF